MLDRLFRRRRAPDCPPDVLVRIRPDRMFRHLDDKAWTRLLARAVDFLRTKSICGTNGFEPDDLVRWTIALQAALPSLNLPFDPYAGFVDVVVYPDSFLARRRIEDDDSVVHEFDDELSGEALDGGPVAIAWPETAPDRDAECVSVVIHEFMHKIDLCDGRADGTPPLPRERRRRWSEVLDAALETFRRDVARVERAIPLDVDPETEGADAYYATLALDPYAATDAAEFFAVAGEAFFLSPDRLASRFPALYGLFVEFFAQDPLRGTPFRVSPPIDR